MSESAFGRNGLADIRAALAFANEAVHSSWDSLLDGLLSATTITPSRAR